MKSACQKELFADDVGPNAQSSITALTEDVLFNISKACLCLFQNDAGVSPRVVSHVHASVIGQCTAHNNTNNNTIRCCAFNREIVLAMFPYFNIIMCYFCVLLNSVHDISSGLNQVGTTMTQDGCSLIYYVCCT